jgi:hypothetical protein
VRKLNAWLARLPLWLVAVITFPVTFGGVTGIDYGEAWVNGWGHRAGDAVPSRRVLLSRRSYQRSQPHGHMRRSRVVEPVPPDPAFTPAQPGQLLIGGAPEPAGRGTWRSEGARNAKNFSRSRRLGLSAIGIVSPGQPTAVTRPGLQPTRPPPISLICGNVMAERASSAAIPSDQGGTADLVNTATLMVEIEDLSAAATPDS